LSSHNLGKYAHTFSYHNLIYVNMLNISWIYDHTLSSHNPFWKIYSHVVLIICTVKKNPDIFPDWNRIAPCVPAGIGFLSGGWLSNSIWKLIWIYLDFWKNDYYIIFCAYRNGMVRLKISNTFGIFSKYRWKGLRHKKIFVYSVRYGNMLLIVFVQSVSRIYTNPLPQQNLCYGNMLPRCHRIICVIDNADIVFS
jgi:hypothetical protein